MDVDKTKIIKFNIVLIIFLNSSVNNILLSFLFFTDSFNKSDNLFFIYTKTSIKNPEKN